MLIPKFTTNFAWTESAKATYGAYLAEHFPVQRARTAAGPSPVATATTQIAPIMSRHGPNVEVLWTASFQFALIAHNG